VPVGRTRRIDDRPEPLRRVGARGDVEADPREEPVLVAEVVLDVDDQQRRPLRVELDQRVRRCAQALQEVVFTNPGA
jgi:hypothetical protein